MSHNIVLLLGILICFSIFDIRAEITISAVDYIRIVNYLYRYGYLMTRFPWLPGSFSNAIEEFQRRAYLPPTGRLNRETLDMINRKRCGVPDVIRLVVTSSRTKRYVLDDTRWKYTNLTYCVRTYPLAPDTTHDGVDRVLAKAFKIWSDVSSLTFTQLPHCNVDIVIQFDSGYHGDRAPFDGKGNTLAHAYFPGDSKRGLNGDVHFDDDEPWTTEGNVPNREDIFCVGVHEIGHSLGLQHSREKGAIMWPWVRQCTDNPLTQDDINGIQALYGPPQRLTTTTPSPPTRTTTPTAHLDPDICSGRIDSVTLGADGKLYGFRGNYVYLFGSRGIVDGYPRVISSVFPDAPSSVDTSVTLTLATGGRGPKTTYTYLFTGNVTYIYTYDVALATFRFYRGPVLFSEVLHLPTRRLDAAFYLNNDNTCYFTRGKVYWKMTIDKRGGTRVSSPRQLSNLALLNGIPVFRTAVRMRTDLIYFFHNTTYFRLEGAGRKRRLVGPLDTAYRWFRCRRPSLYQIGLFP
ncbi:matrix metalloproteinase-14-like [Haliotis asinina]|uniref:matrix metalloproteinase-14-like n=1 Tax=Haliotis asinina TaxID=109174 RepID=UPI003531B941